MDVSFLSKILLALLLEKVLHPMDFFSFFYLDGTIPVKSPTIDPHPWINTFQL